MLRFLTLRKPWNPSCYITSYEFVKSDALDASNETPELNVRNDSDIANVQKDIENQNISKTLFQFLNVCGNRLTR